MVEICGLIICSGVCGIMVSIVFVCVDRVDVLSVSERSVVLNRLEVRFLGSIVRFLD